MIKHSFEVTGITSDKENFIGKCVCHDIIEAIQMFRENGYSVHTVQNMVQVHAKTEIGIEYINKSLYHNNESMPLTETFVAQEMYKIFSRDDLDNFAIVRKQILRNKEVEYFKRSL